MQSLEFYRSAARLVAPLIVIVLSAPASSLQLPRRPSLSATHVQLVADQWRGARVVRSPDGIDGWCSWHQFVRARAMAPGAPVSSAQLQACMELKRWPSQDCRTENGKRVRLRTISGVTYCIPVARR